MRVWQQQTHAYSMHAACAAVHMFLYNAYTQLDLPSSGSSSSGGGDGGSSTSSLQAVLQQQVQESGLLAFLPDVIAIVTTALHARAQPAAQGGSDSEAATTQGASSISSSSTSIYSHVDEHDFERHIQLVLTLADRVWWPLGGNSLPVATALQFAAPMSGLALAILQYISIRVQQAAPSLPSTAALLKNMGIHASKTMVQVATRAVEADGFGDILQPPAAGGNDSTQGQSRVFTQSVASFTMVVLFAHMQQMRPAGAAQQVTDSSSSGDGCPCGDPNCMCGIDHTRLWQSSARLAARLSASQQELCQLLGLDSRALLEKAKQRPCFCEEHVLRRLVTAW